MNVGKMEEGLRPLRHEGGVLDKIFNKEDLARMERLHRIARCRAIVAELLPQKDTAEVAESLAVLRQLLRIEYGAALACYVHGDTAAHPLPRSESNCEPRAGKLRNLVTAIKGRLLWTR